VAERATAGLPKRRLSDSAGEYYTGVGLQERRRHGAADWSMSTSDLCLDAGINHEGINAEVAEGQGSSKSSGKGSYKAADGHVDGAATLLMRLCGDLPGSMSIGTASRSAATGTARGCTAIFFDQVHARKGGKAYFAGADGGVREEPRRAHRRVWS